MTDDCPYGTNACPKIEHLEEEMHALEADVKADLRGLYATIDTMKRTLYVIAGILLMELGVTVI